MQSNYVAITSDTLGNVHFVPSLENYLKFPKLLNEYLLHSISSGQETPNMSMSFWQSLLACVHRLRHGRDTRPYSIHTGAYRAHRNGLRSGEHCRFTMGWKGWWEGERRVSSCQAPREFMTDLVKTHSLALAAVWEKNELRWTCLARV